MSPEPIIFISAVSKELHAAREAVAQVLRTQGYAVDYQPDFGTEHGDIREMLRRRIDPCEGVIQLVGQRYGFEPPAPDETHGRVSYTQYEALHARSLRKKVWYFILDENFPSDTQEAQTPEEAELQQVYRDRVLKGTHVYHPIPTLDSLRLKVHEMKNQLEVLRKDWLQHRERLESGVSKIEQMLVEQTAPGRLAAYKRSLLSAFRPYQELAIDNFAAAEQAAPDIWDIFVHPACSSEHLRPEDMDEAQRETPPRLPAHDLLPLLAAQDDHRRTVLLADPGMGKSTLIQSLIAHLASGRSFKGAAALTGLLPVPLILRDLVPLLPQDQVAGWSWNDLLTVLIEHYQRDETAPPLCDCFKDHRAEFRQLLHTDAKVFFLIDGLDEIGDLTKRRQIVRCIQNGIRAVNQEARWLITSRVVGYENAPVDFALWEQSDLYEFAQLANSNKEIAEALIRPVWRRYAEKWKPYLCRGTNDFIETTLELSRDALMLNENFHVHPNNLPHFLSGKDCFPIARRLHLAPFDDKRQDEFTQRWFHHRHSTNHSKELIREVRAHRHDGVRIISRVPNLLCMMNILKRSGKPLPDGRAALYDAIVQAYLGGIDAAYRLRPVHGDLCPFDTAQRRFLLALLGAEMQDTRTVLDDANSDNNTPKLDGNILITRPHLEKLLLPAINSMREAGKVQSNHTSAELLGELLQHIASRSGLLIPRSSDTEGNTLYGFTHLSFLEFFAAEWLGLEFDRQRNRNSRRTEAIDDGLPISDAGLDSEFPPLGPIQHARESFKDMPPLPAWHEPLIFLLETRKADTPTLLRWLFPTLHSSKPHFVSKDEPTPTPLLPLTAVQLAANLTQDTEIPLPAAARQTWWRILWHAYLTWPFHPATGNQPTDWPIAPLLLGVPEHRTEVVEALIAVYSSPELIAWPQEEKGSQAAMRTLFLIGCAQLTSADLTQLTALTHLKRILLNDCVGLETLPELSSLINLEDLYLNNCTGLRGPNAFDALSELTQLRRLLIRNCPGLIRLPDLGTNKALEILDLNDNKGFHGPEALSGLTKLEKLKFLSLAHCTELECLPDLSALVGVKRLVLWGCTGLHGPEALSGLSRLTSLLELSLVGCTGLKKDYVAELKRKLGEKCKISGP